MATRTTGMMIGETQDFADASIWVPAGVHYGEYRIGGTSLSSPLFAGIEAVAQGLHRRIGFANPRIYSLAHSGVFYDVTPQGDAGNVRSNFANGIQPLQRKPLLGEDVRPGLVALHGSWLGRRDGPR